LVSKDKNVLEMGYDTINCFIPEPVPVDPTAKYSEDAKATFSWKGFYYNNLDGFTYD
jgi:hypothetical protein